MVQMRAGAEMHAATPRGQTIQEVSEVLDVVEVEDSASVSVEDDSSINGHSR
jgi:hypothetical protein